MDKPPLYMKLWTWMLLKANHKENKGLKRGQFHTSISEMQEAMSFMIGYRKIIPKKDHIRRAYEHFSNATMIDTTKTTRGMVISILNYDIYQTPKHYEAHSEAHSEDIPKLTDDSQDKQELKNEKNVKKSTKTYTRESLPYRFAEYFLSEIRKRDEKAKANLQTWAKDMDAILRIDQRTEDELRKIIQFRSEDDFERKVVLSPKSLRKNFTRLVIKMNEQSTGSGWGVVR